MKSGAGFDNFRALIVEDNGNMRLLLRELLNSVGIREISEAANGQAALAVLRDHNCDLILSDMAMAPMDGIAFTRHVRTNESSPNHFVPIIMVTGHTEKARVEAARDARIAEIVERPRAFVRTETYFGPDRRRKTPDHYGGPWRRHDDYDVGEKPQ